MTNAGPIRTQYTALYVPHLIELIATVGSPVAVGTALLYYFGWVRAVVQAKTLGYDASLAGLTVEDYLLKSINVLFLPIVALLLLGLGLVAAHRRVMTRAENSPTLRAALLRTATGIRYLWVLILPTSLIVAALRLPGAFYAVPTALLFVTLAVLYGSAVRNRLDSTASEEDPGADTSPTTTARLRTHEASQPVTGGAFPIGRALVFVLLLLAMFWETERFARTMGEAYAQDIIARPEQLAAVTILSTRRLAMDGPCVDEKMTTRQPDEYRFQYQGLRLLETSSDRHFVIATCAQETKVFMLHDSDGLLLEFSVRSNGGH